MLHVEEIPEHVQMMPARQQRQIGERTLDVKRSLVGAAVPRRLPVIGALTLKRTWRPGCIVTVHGRHSYNAQVEEFPLIKYNL